MARAEDYAAVGAGLDSIGQSILQRRLQDFRDQQAAEEKQRHAAMQQWRASQLAQQQTAQQDTNNFHQGTLLLEKQKFARQIAGDEATANGQATAKAQQARFRSRFAPEPDRNLGAPEEGYVPDPGLAPTPENLMQVGIETGALSPAELLKAALENQKITAAGGSKEKAIVQGTATTADGTDHEYAIAPNGTVTWFDKKTGETKGVEPILGTDGKPMQGWARIDGKPHQVKIGKDVELTKHYETLRKIEAEMTAITPAARAADKAKYLEWKSLGDQRDDELNFIQRNRPGTHLEITPAPQGPPVSQPAASPAPAKPVPMIGRDGSFVAPKGPAAPTPPDDRGEQFPEDGAPPEGAPPAQPEPAGAPAPRLRGFAPVPVPAFRSGRSPGSNAAVVSAQAQRAHAAELTRDLTQAVARLTAARSGQRGSYMSPQQQNELQADVIRKAIELQKLNPEAARLFLE